jgi:ABC-type spermidine/putrescine transport system permease subunit I
MDSTPFSKYKDLFGKPHAGLRKYRIFDIAILDVVVTVICAYAIAWFFKWTFWKVLAIVFISGIFVHRLFSVRTGLDKKLFPSN